MSLMVVVEGDTDRPVIHKLARDAGIGVHEVIDSGGKDQLDLHVRAYNRAAKGSPWLVLRDLDSDRRCAGQIVTALIGKPAEWMVFRLAMREVESWLLADGAAIAKFLGVHIREIPADPDGEADPKQTIVNLARRSSLSAVRRALVPRAGVSSPVGPLYEAKLIEFAVKHWSLPRAAARSSSLGRARAALRKLAQRWRAYVGERD